MQKVIQYIKHSLKEYYPETEIKSLTKIIFCEAFSINMLDIYAGKDIKLSKKQLDELDDIIGRLKNQEPIQYVIGHTEFYGLTLDVNEKVLIPRPETEELVDLIIKENKELPLAILDIGTGSGCIALALALNLPLAKVTAWDISAEALDVAMRNAATNHAIVQFEERDILTTTNVKQSFGLIVSNPPYVMNKEKTEIEANVLNWEPGLALFVPDEDPLLFYRTIAEFGLNALVPQGKIYFEINQALGLETKKMMEKLGYEAEVLKDLSGRDRMVRAQL